MSFYRPTKRNASPEVDNSPPKQSRPVGGIIFVIVAIVLIVAIVILIIIWLVVRTRTTTKKSTSTTTTKTESCTKILPAPTNVLAVYNQNNNTAALSWQAVAGATRYRVYRKLEDPAVNTGNYEQRIDTINNSYNFIDLPVGTHYFVVTSFSSCGNESPISTPVVFSPSCGTELVAIDLGSVTPNISDLCGDPNPGYGVEVMVNYNPIFQNGIVVFNGGGQEGESKSHLSIFDSDGSTNPDLQVALECDGAESQHYLSYITDVQNVPISPLTTALATSPTTSLFTINWAPIAGAEMYVVAMQTENPTTGIPHRYGGYSPSSQTTLSLATNPGDDILEIKVRAFRICNRSPLSAAIPVTSSTVPPPPS